MPWAGFVKLTIIIMTIKAKFRCNSVSDDGYKTQAKLQAVYATEGENADYSKATPYGQLEISIDKETKGADFFQPTKDYYLTFEEAINDKSATAKK